MFTHKQYKVLEDRKRIIFVQKEDVQKQLFNQFCIKNVDNLTENSQKKNAILLKIRYISANLNDYNDYIRKQIQYQINVEN